MADGGNKSYGLWPGNSGAESVAVEAGAPSYFGWPIGTGAVPTGVQAGCRSYLLWPFGCGSGVAVVEPVEPVEGEIPGGYGGELRRRRRRFRPFEFPRPAFAGDNQLELDDEAVLLAVMEFVLCEDEEWEPLLTV